MKKKLINEISRMKKLAGLITENELDQDQLKQIMKGYIDCAFFTEEERLKEEAQGKDEEDDDDNYQYGFDDDDDDEDDNELEKLLKLQKDLKRKSFDSFSEENIDVDSIIQAYSDIKKFISQINPESLKIAIEEQGEERLGMDIWLTRNGHGAGFFDHTYPKEVEEDLTRAAKNLKEVDIYIGDDDMLHFSNI